MNGQAVVLVPLITALVEVAKKVGLPNRFCPILSLVVGLALSALIPSSSLYETVIVGLGFGLSAIGAYEVSSSGVEAVKNKIK